MEDAHNIRIFSMAKLALSSIDRISGDDLCWREQSMHKAILIGGIAVLVASNQILEGDL